MTTEAGPAEREAELVKLRRRMRRAARRGDAVVLEGLSAEYAEAKAVHVVQSHEEQRAAALARRAEKRAVGAQQQPRAWRLPRGFSSPLAAERARSGWRPRVEPQHPGGGLSPWRRSSPAAEVIWRPGR